MSAAHTQITAHPVLPDMFRRGPWHHNRTKTKCGGFYMPAVLQGNTNAGQHKANLLAASGRQLKPGQVICSNVNNEVVMFYSSLGNVELDKALLKATAKAFVQKHSLTMPATISIRGEATSTESSPVSDAWFKAAWTQVIPDLDTYAKPQKTHCLARAARFCLPCCFVTKRSVQLAQSQRVELKGNPFKPENLRTAEEVQTAIERVKTMEATRKKALGISEDSHTHSTHGSLLGRLETLLETLKATKTSMVLHDHHQTAAGATATASPSDVALI